jgi:hypothetical protein
MWRKVTLASVVLSLGLLSLSTADNSENDGTWESKGRLGSASWTGDLVKSGSTGTLTMTLTSRRYRRAGPIQMAVKFDGNKMTVVGTAVSGMISRLSGSDATNQDVSFLGSFKNGKFKVKAQQSGNKFQPKNSAGEAVGRAIKVRSISGKGTRVSTGDTDGDGNDGGNDDGNNDGGNDDGTTEEPTVERIKIGRDGADIKPNTTYEIIVPLAGKLTVKAGGGELTVTRPDGNKVEDATAAVEIDDKQLGKYTVTVKDGSGTISASFEQDGRIDSRIRPWSSHTWYPINSISSGTSENRDTMYHTGGPLEKFDKAFKLEGSDSSQHWEINGYGNRTGLGFENGHYSRIGSPKETNWIVDCNLNGVRRYEDDAAYMKMVDTDGNDEVSAEELKAHGINNSLLTYFKTYDKNGDGSIADGEISSGFISKYDGDDDKKLSQDEWTAALKKDYNHLLEQDADKEMARTLEERDNDGDGKLSKAEASPSNGMDVIDRGDQDGDGREYYDVNNTVVVMKNGKKHVGNKTEEKDGVVTLFKGHKRDEKVGEYKRDEILRVLTNASDGEYNGSYSVGWWGHCNAWAMAAIMYQVPKAEIEHNGVKFSIRDQKALLVELAMRDTQDSTFWWQQWNNTDTMPDAKYAAGFHRQLQKWLRDEQQGMMADMDLKPIVQTTGFQVWNYPLIGYVAKVREADGDDPYVLEMDVKVQKGSYSDENSESTQALTYTLHYNEDGSIREEEGSKTDWTTKKGWGDDAPKGYVRYLMHPFGFSGGLSSANPYVTIERLEKVFGGKLKRNSVDEIEGAATPEAGE